MVLTKLPGLFSFKIPQCAHETPEARVGASGSSREELHRLRPVELIRLSPD